MATKRKPRKKVARQRRTTKEPILVKIDFWAIAAKEVYDACRRAGMDEGTALAFATAMKGNIHSDKFVIHLDSDCYFKGECISDIILMLNNGT